MKKYAFIAMALFFFIFAGVLYGFIKKGSYQFVDLYLCESDAPMAELAAKVKVSRKELLVVSFCSCEGVAHGVRSSLANMTCAPPKDTVYSCYCIGRNHY